MTKNTAEKLKPRPPIVVIMGHVDHGKSSLLDYIRKTNVVATESGGITQHISAYEAEHNGKKITFLDTPGHAAFSSLRERGVHLADIAVLIVSAEDGAKTQTIEAYKNILSKKIPFIVAATKTDKPNADLEKVKQSLVEKEIYVEGYGGDIPFVAISSKTGDGIPELLDLIILAWEIEPKMANAENLAEGIVLESMIDSKKGIVGNVIITNGTLKNGMFVVAGKSIAPVRIFENFMSKKITEASFSSPVRIIGWSDTPPVGANFRSFTKKKEAEEYILNSYKPKEKLPEQSNQEADVKTLPLIIKADTQGSIEAVIHEMELVKKENLKILVVKTGVGSISEADIKTAMAKEGALVLGFNISIDPAAKRQAEQNGVSIETSSIIYKLTEKLEEVAEKTRPRVTEDIESGLAKIQKIFNSKRNAHVVGGKVISGTISSENILKIKRRENIIGEAKIKELQQNKSRTSSVEEGKEFGALIETNIEVVPGDFLQAITVTEK